MPTTLIFIRVLQHLSASYFILAHAICRQRENDDQFPRAIHFKQTTSS